MQSGKILCKFRLNNTRLPIITGRYRNIARELRICNICNTGRRGDEYHIFFECQNDIKEMCQQFLPKKYISRPSSLN